MAEHSSSFGTVRRLTTAPRAHGSQQARQAQRPVCQGRRPGRAGLGTWAQARRVSPLKLVAAVHVESSQSSSLGRTWHLDRCIAPPHEREKRDDQRQRQRCDDSNQRNRTSAVSPRTSRVWSCPSSSRACGLGRPRSCRSCCSRRCPYEKCQLQHDRDMAHDMGWRLQGRRRTGVLTLAFTLDRSHKSNSGTAARSTQACPGALMSIAERSVAFGSGKNGCGNSETNDERRACPPAQATPRVGEVKSRSGPGPHATHIPNTYAHRPHVHSSCHVIIAPPRSPTKAICSKRHALWKDGRGRERKKKKHQAEKR